MHFIRPHFFYLIIPAVLLLLFMIKNQAPKNQWQKACDLHLLPHLTITNPMNERKWPLLALFIALMLAIVAMAGPSWYMTNVPVFNNKSPLVILLDMSDNMTAGDVKPSRLVRAKYKIVDLLKQRKMGQTGLIAYTSEPFVVSPLTEDGKTILNLLQVLQPNIMPVQGQNVSKAIAKANEMIAHAGLHNGHILVISNSASGANYTQEENSASISVLGIGTPSGSPITDDRGRLIKNANGQLIMSKLEVADLKKLAVSGGGLYQTFTSDNADILNLSRVTQIDNHDAQQSKLHGQLWQDDGHWFILMLLPFMALVFRRGYL